MDFRNKINFRLAQKRNKIYISHALYTLFQISWPATIIEHLANYSSLFFNFDHLRGTSNRGIWQHLTAFNERDWLMRIFPKGCRWPWYLEQSIIQNLLSSRKIIIQFFGWFSIIGPENIICGQKKWLCFGILWVFDLL